MTLGFVALGLVMNLAPIVANGRMPFSTDAAHSAGITEAEKAEHEASIKNESADGDTQMAWMGEVIPVRPIRKVIGVGDVFIMAGIAWLISAGMVARSRGLLAGGDPERGQTRSEMSTVRTVTDDLEYRLRKRTRRKTGYPMATLIAYGPDESRASKLVASIVFSEEDDAEDFPMKKWFSDHLDVRSDQAIMQELLEFLDEHDVHRVVAMDRIFGCPHEEGIDYPEGEVCPECPYWANRDRYTGEMKN
jgi:hypothetical protein